LCFVWCKGSKHNKCITHQSTLFHSNNDRFYYQKHWKLEIQGHYSLCVLNNDFIVSFSFPEYIQHSIRLTFHKLLCHYHSNGTKRRMNSRRFNCTDLMSMNALDIIILSTLNKCRFTSWIKCIDISHTPTYTNTLLCTFCITFLLHKHLYLLYTQI